MDKNVQIKEVYTEEGSLDLSEIKRPKIRSDKKSSKK
jgi:hypothetical protein